MYITATLTDGPEDVLDPKHRTIYFEDAQSMVVYFLRQGWTCKVPDEKLRAVGVEQAYEDWIMNDFQNSGAAEERVSPHADVAGLERSPSKDDVDTEWRKWLIKQYMHLYYDIGNTIHEVNCRMGHYHPPAHDSWVLHYPPAGSPARGVVRRWDQNVIILPAFLDKGVAITAYRVVDRETEPAEEGLQEVVSIEMGRFTENLDAAWFVKAGMDIKFEIRADADAGDGDNETPPQGTGVAAVFAVGPLCLDSHGEEPCHHEILGAE